MDLNLGSENPTSGAAEEDLSKLEEDEKSSFPFTMKFCSPSVGLRGGPAEQ